MTAWALKKGIGRQEAGGAGLRGGVGREFSRLFHSYSQDYLT